jgi:hypothetical protein
MGKSGLSRKTVRNARGEKNSDAVGHYTDSTENKKYAVPAYHLLTQQSNLPRDKRALWESVTQYSEKKPNE